MEGLFLGGIAETKGMFRAISRDEAGVFLRLREVRGAATSAVRVQVSSIPGLRRPVQPRFFPFNSYSYVGSNVIMTVSG
jgi:hypothetical protein